MKTKNFIFGLLALSVMLGQANADEFIRDSSAYPREANSHYSGNYLCTFTLKKEYGYFSTQKPKVEKRFIEWNTSPVVVNTDNATPSTYYLIDYTMGAFDSYGKREKTTTNYSIATLMGYNQKTKEERPYSEMSGSDYSNYMLANYVSLVDEMSLGEDVNARYRLSIRFLAYGTPVLKYQKFINGVLDTSTGVTMSDVVCNHI